MTAAGWRADIEEFPSVKVVLFANNVTKNAAIRNRVLRFAEMLRADGYTCIVCLPNGSGLYRRCIEKGGKGAKVFYHLVTFLRRCTQVPRVLDADAVFIHRDLFPYGPPFFERIVHRLNPRVAFDIDDAVWERPAYVESPFLSFQDFDWVWKMCRMCVQAVVGNNYLREHVAPHIGTVTVIPTCIDMSIHTAKTYPEPSPDRPVVLGWTGLWTNLGYFEVIEDVLKALAQKHRIVLKVASNGTYRLDGVEVVNEEWEMAREVDYLREADIGLMPLTYSKRAMGKCAYKALAHMAVGTPCVISPVGMNAEVIEDGVTGFLADSPEEWHDKLERLIVDPALRERMGRAARQAVIDRYSHEANYPKFKQVIESTAAWRMP
ncbi:MAG TPA: glycosyltransferase family 4 protein [Candidatus Hydrogenedentes bacterium]|nr:glycosyltransferase family 4 protein [Candidatus Hydrogenedentota bacterium]HPG69042.1 glycosyltransferase family 4 protein [Candidatus Hydrogenedentota bacterium]